MHWLSSPKVRLALLVNGLYLFSLVSPPPHWWRARVFPHTFGERAGYEVGYERRPREWPAYAPLPPAAGPSRAMTYRGEGTNQVEVYLTKDLTLVEQPGHTLLLSPIYTADADAAEPPATILLRFVSFSRAQVYEDDSPLHVFADGALVWPASPLLSGARPSDQRARHSATDGEDGRVVETVGESMPYELFVELVSASSVSIQLGPDKVELSPEQIEALRDLHRKLPRPNRPRAR